MITSLLLASFLAQSQPAGPQAPAQGDPKCKLEGQVISAATGAPLKRAVLRLSPAGAGTSGEPGTDFTSSTDSSGRFVMANVDPGTYTLNAERSGYIAQQYGARSENSDGTRLKLESGQSMKDLLFRMVPQGVVFGKVVDEDGEPVPNVSVQGQRWRLFGGKRRLVQSGSASSQADGTFVMGDLDAGQIYLSAERQTTLYDDFERAAAKKDDEFLKTYYPNALDFTSASAIEMTPGGEIRGIEIHMRRGRLYEIRGVVQNATSGPMPDGVNLVIFGRNDGFNFGERSQAYAQGKKKEFVFKGLAPGAYQIQTLDASVVAVDASGDMRTSARLSGRLEVTISDSDLENVIFPLVPALELTGSIKLDGDSTQQSQAPSWTNFDVILRPVDGSVFGRNAGRVSEQGNFRIRNLAPAVYRVVVTGTPDGSYVKAIRFGGEDFTNKDLDLTSAAGGDLEIVISPNAADISGVVRNENGETLAGVSVQAFAGNELKKSASTDQNGAFHFTSLAPGDYRVYAWEDIDPGMSQDADFRKNFDSKAAAVKLEEKGHQSLEVKLISKDAIDAEAVKIR